MTSYTFPHKFTPRPYQEEVFKARDEGCRFFFLLWMRRSGKDKLTFNFMVREAFKRVGLYFYILPTYSQSKKVIWHQIGHDGFPMMDHIPKELIESKNSQELMVKLKNGSVIMLVGSDNMDSLVGSNPVGIVYSEFSVQEAAAWDYLRPVIFENDGWVIWQGTPRGENHFKELNDYAMKHPDYFHSKVDNDMTGIMSEELFRMERETGKSESFLRQEYFVEFSAQPDGVYYLDDIVKAREEGRVGSFDHNPNLPVFTSWDLGISDDLVIWFGQYIGNRIVWIDYFEDRGKPLKYYVKHLMDTGYEFSRHCLPHDADHNNLQTGKTTNELLKILMEDFVVSGDVDTAPRLRVQAGINAVRSRFYRFYFNEPLVHIGLDKLANYHAKYDEKRGVVLPTPVHDVNSHAADALRTESLLEEDDTGWGKIAAGHNAPDIAPMSDPFGDING